MTRHKGNTVNTRLDSYLFAKSTKPNDAIKTLQEALKPFGKVFTLPRNHTMELSKERDKAFILMFEYGCFSLFHEGSELAISTAFSPTVMGLIDAYSLYYGLEKRPQHYVLAETYCTGWSIPLDIFLAKCDELVLWHDVAKILAQRLMVMSARETELVGKDAYSKIRALLLELSRYPDNIREQINIAAFISHRTKMSKSRIMSILSELRTGEYITTNKGVLTSITKLPTSF
ncbi:TPA: helix-turn-helix domain-containing protein [Escherichia coli]|nr:helix-turn-helix domain-containing protein [Escherichia coli]MBS9237887.1 helix-turn-helix domain-containing protein [Escherichia coli]HCN8310447.1 helix-turn-helix domain-containing protein [Escherichia coli]HCO7722215.1 helix-turn-helix domain-containing protein [Escherichia coli]